LPGGLSNLFIVGPDKAGVFVTQKSAIEDDDRDAGIHCLRDRLGEGLCLFGADNDQIHF
jgi:hypothetical protein